MLESFRIESSIFSFYKFFGKTSQTVTETYYYSSCGWKIHKRGDTCSNCPETDNSNSSFFLSTPSTDQIRDTVLKNYKAIMKFKADNCHGDVINGTYYQELVVVHGPNDVTLQIKLDGVCLLKYTNRSLWPIQIMLNELSLQKRRLQIILCGL